MGKERERIWVWLEMSEVLGLWGGELLWVGLFLFEWEGFWLGKESRDGGLGGMWEWGIGEMVGERWWGKNGGDLGEIRVLELGGGGKDGFG